jgi:hypothetical protein
MIDPGLLFLLPYLGLSIPGLEILASSLRMIKATNATLYRCYFVLQGRGTAIN